MNIGYVIFDAVCLALGAVGLRATVRGSTIQAIFQAATPAMSGIEQAIAQIGRSGATAVDQAKGVFNILKAIWSGGSLGAVFSAFTGSLTWWDMALYGVTGLATIVAALATDGLAFVAEVVILLASFGFLASDSVKAIQACNLTQTPAPAPQAFLAAKASAQGGQFSAWTPIPGSGAVTFITVLPDGTLAGIGTDKNVYTRQSLTDSWALIADSGSVTSLSTLGGLYIATGTDNQIYYTLSLGTAWQLASNSGAVTCVTFLSDGRILGIGTDQSLYVRSDLNDVWVPIPESGNVVSVAVLSDGTIAGVGTDNLIYVREALTSVWVQVAGSGAIISLAALPNAGVIVGVGTDNNLYTTPMMDQ